MKKIEVVCTAIVLAMAGSASAETLTWTGAESSNWDLTAVNWTNESGVATAWVNGNDAFFPSDASSSVSVTGDVELRNLSLATRANSFSWNDGGGSLTFVSNDANPTNNILMGSGDKHHHLHARITCVAPLVKRGNEVLYFYNANNSLPGGVFQTMSQMRICASTAVGPGAVTMLGSSTVFNYSEPIAPDVKFIQDSNNNLLGSVGPMLTIKSVGATPNNAARVFRIGRAVNACAITLSLTDPESEGIGQYVLVGASSAFTLDGGVVKASPVTRDRFFTTTAGANPIMRVTRNGITFDTAGANTDLGVPLTFDAPKIVTNVLETVKPNNWSFETTLNSSADWSKSDMPGETSSAQSNTSAFIVDQNSFTNVSYQTTNGNCFVVLRRSGTLSQQVNLPTAGLWRVVYERGCRPTGDWLYPSKEMTVTVSLGGDANSTISPTNSTIYPFRREETALFQLDAGQHLLKFVAGPHDNQNTSVFLDAVRLERCEVVTIPTGPLVKKGDGTLVVTNLVSAGRVAVSNGTLAVKGTTLDGPSVDVANGGTLALYATRLTNATVCVAAGGALSFRDDLVMNGSFEENVLEPNGARGYTSGNGPFRWTFKRKDGAEDDAGIQANGSAFSIDGAKTDCGNQTAFMRPRSQLKQTVIVPVAGAYDVSFLHGCRFGYPSYTLPVTLQIDGVEVASNGVHEANYEFARSVTRVNLTAGTHTILFDSLAAPTEFSNRRYATIFIDDVRLTSAVGLNTLGGNTFAFASGATLDLQNSEPIYLAGGVTVDGQEVKGGRNALRSAGLTVTGTGSIQIGPPQGALILFR